MTAQDWPVCYQRLRVHEGGNDDDPVDPGGRTSRGIIQREYNAYRSRKGLPRRDVWSASEDEITEIYRNEYWMTEDCCELPAGVDDCIFDYGVNSGIGRSGKVLRRVLGLSDNTSVVTPDVIRAVLAVRADQVVDAICDERLRFLKGLGTWWKYGNGWTRRVSEVRQFAHQLSTGGQVVMPKVPVNDGKGQVKVDPKKKGGAAGGAVAGGGAIASQAHTTEMIFLILVLAALVAIGIVVAINVWQKHKQEAVVPHAIVTPTGVIPPK